MCAGNVSVTPNIAAFGRIGNVVRRIVTVAGFTAVVARTRFVCRDRQFVYQYKHRHDNKSNNSLFHHRVFSMLIGSCQPNICRMPTEVVRLSRAFGLTQVRDWRQSTHAAVRTRLDKTIVGGVNVRARVQVELNLEATQ